MTFTFNRNVADNSLYVCTYCIDSLQSLFVCQLFIYSWKIKIVSVENYIVRAGGGIRDYLPNGGKQTTMSFFQIFCFSNDTNYYSDGAVSLVCPLYLTSNSLTWPINRPLCLCILGGRVRNITWQQTFHLFLSKEMVWRFYCQIVHE